MTSNEIQPVEEQVNNELSTSAIAPVVASAKALQKKVDEEVALRKVLTDYITVHMKDGTDFGAIHISKNCQNPYNCNIKGHYSKPSLFKPGAEKFLSLMKFTIIYTKDDETWEMAGRQTGLFCYKASVLDGKGRVVGEGRGACSIQEKQNPNIAIKIAEKRAKIDAVLSTGGLSDFFTQDVEDFQPTNQNTFSQHFTGGRNNAMVQKGVNTNAKASERQKMLITKLVRQKGKTQLELDDAISARGATDIDDLTMMQASEIIQNLMQLPDLEDQTVNVDDIPENLGA